AGVGVALGDHDGRPFLGEQLTGGPADAGPAAGHDGDLVLQSVHVGFSRWTFARRMAKMPPVASANLRPRGSRSRLAPRVGAPTRGASRLRDLARRATYSERTFAMWPDSAETQALLDLVRRDQPGAVDDLLARHRAPLRRMI